MTLDEYQKMAAKTANYNDPFYPIASLMVESAELGDLFIKPWLRGDQKDVCRKEVVSEAGDVLWNLAMLLYDHSITMEEVALFNLQKLADREKRGVIKGDGGDR
jgi:NTP pyrophosphatase (non-canonical NTP hydrolase)